MWEKRQGYETSESREDSLARDSKSRVAGAREESRDADEKSVCENYKQSSDEKHYRKDYHEDDVDETEAATYEEGHVVFFAGFENILSLIHI